MCTGSAGLSWLSYLSCQLCSAFVLVQSSVFAVINLCILAADISYASARFLCKQETAKVTARHSLEGLAQ